jgi:hypothetical protein
VVEFPLFAIYLHHPPAWDAQRRTLVVTDRITTVTMTVGQTFIWISDTHRIRADTVQVVNGVVFAPLRTIVEQFVHIEWEWTNGRLFLDVDWTLPILRGHDVTFTHEEHMAIYKEFFSHTNRTVIELTENMIVDRLY